MIRKQVVLEVLIKGSKDNKSGRYLGISTGTRRFRDNVVGF